MFEELYAEQERQEAARMAHMSNTDIQYWIDRIETERAEPLYHLKVNSAEAKRSVSALCMYQREMKRRNAVPHAIAAE